MDYFVVYIIQNQLQHHQVCFVHCLISPVTWQLVLVYLFVKVN